MPEIGVPSDSADRLSENCAGYSRSRSRCAASCAMVCLDDPLVDQARQLRAAVGAISLPKFRRVPSARAHAHEYLEAWRAAGHAERQYGLRQQLERIANTVAGQLHCGAPRAAGAVARRARAVENLDAVAATLLGALAG
jgi:hypothetical protein